MTIEHKRRFQFSLLALFGLTTTAALLFGAWVNWKAVGGILIFFASMAAALLLFVIIRVAILWALTGVEERADQ